MIRLLTLAFAMLPASAFAHPGHDAGGFFAGLSHPMGGPDHILAMVTVGLWAVQSGPRALWAMPATFVAAMLAGATLGLSDGIGGTEQVILASIIVLGAASALALRLPQAVALPLVALFGAAHGMAHGAEADAGQALFIVGFTVATLTLHVAGIAAGCALLARRSPNALRALGGATVAAGALMMLN
jgi:urease accessory protein